MAGLIDLLRSVASDFAKEHAPLLLPGIAGVAVTVLTSEHHSLKSAVARVGAGLFCAVSFTDALLNELGRDPSVYRTPVAALLAMTGFQIVRSFSSLDLPKIVELIKSARGGK